MSILGVIDLKGGLAVHAVAGRRRHYQPLHLSSQSTPGDPKALADHYRSLGVGGLYVADLDGILHFRPSWSALQNLALVQPKLWLDIGLREPTDLTNATRHLTHSPQVTWIVATETCRGNHPWKAWLRVIPSGHLALGIDIRGGRLVGSRQSPETLISEASLAGIRHFVILDLSSVGGGRGPIAGPLCRKVRQWAPQATIVSGGGVRNRTDQLMLQRNGCDLVLMATALLPHRQPSPPPVSP